MQSGIAVSLMFVFCSLVSPDLSRAVSDEPQEDHFKDVGS